MNRETVPTFHSLSLSTQQVAPYCEKKKMAENAEYQPGPLPKIFATVGFFAGAAVVSESGDGMAILIGAIIMSLIGFGVGRIAEAVIVRLIFVAAVVIEFMINSTIRHFIFGLFH